MTPPAAFGVLPPEETWQDRPRWVDGEPERGVFPHSTLCRQDDFEKPYFSHWTRKMGLWLGYHRKLWEMVYICQSLWERGTLRPGARGLGFGVGREPLAACFASEGCAVLGTDLAGDHSSALGWTQTEQHAAGLETLRFPSICPDDLFDRNVAFRVCDMNHIPDDLQGFDFCWSACAFEHLGSIEKGLRFYERSLDCLRPGGWAVHTTEFNTTSNHRTLSTGGTVLFRRRDFEKLALWLAAAGHRPAPFDFAPGQGLVDGYVDVPPYRVVPHLRVAVAGFATTSFGVIAQRGE